MNIPDADDKFCEDGIYYLKKSIQLLAEPSSKQYAELSKYGLLEEVYDEVMSGEYFCQGKEFSDEARSSFKSMSTRLRRICDLVFKKRVQVLEMEDFESMEWQELRSIAKEILLLFDAAAQNRRVD